MKKSGAQKLKGSVALVFGATGDIGGAIARGLCRAGATVIPTGRNKQRLNRVVRELNGQGNTWFRSVTADITKKKQIKVLCRAVHKKYKRIDIMVCASGIYLNKPAERVATHKWNSILDTNLTGTFQACQIVGTYMIRQGKGSIITIGSLGSFVALSNTIAYSVSKAGVVALTRGLATEWARYGVRVNALIPGVFPTRLNHKALQKKGRKKNILRGIPLKRLGKVDELAGAAVFLASDESSYITGTSFPVDGGFLSFSGY